MVIVKGALAVIWPHVDLAGGVFLIVEGMSSGRFITHRLSKKIVHFIWLISLFIPLIASEPTSCL